MFRGPAVTHANVVGIVRNLRLISLNEPQSRCVAVEHNSPRIVEAMNPNHDMRPGLLNNPLCDVCNRGLVRYLFLFLIGDRLPSGDRRGARYPQGRRARPPRETCGGPALTYYPPDSKYLRPL